MLLTITYEGEHTQDLGYLLHKNPGRAQQFALNYGKAYVFYPEVSDGRTTAALLLETNQHPGQLKDAVCSPGGTTIAGVQTLEDRGFRAASMQAVLAAMARTRAMREGK